MIGWQRVLDLVTDELRGDAVLYGWQPLKPSRPGAEDSVFQLEEPRLIEFRREDGSTVRIECGAGETRVYGFEAFRIVKQGTR